MDTKSLQNRNRLTERRKAANDFQWYKDRANLLDSMSLSHSAFLGFGEISDQMRMKVNYNLFNNIINMQDFAYVCKPYGENAGELPADFSNRDIVSGKIKVLLGMEMKMPFQWKTVAVNEEATTRKEEEEMGRIRDFVVSSAMKPIRMQSERAAREKTKGKQLTPQEQMDLQQELEDEIAQKTPDKVRLYMTREHQDPAEALSRQLLQYLLLEKKIGHKFNKGWKHSNLSGYDAYWIGIINGEPDMEVVNPLFFDHDKSPDSDFIEDGEWACREMRLTPTDVIAKFGSQLSKEEIDRIYEFTDNPSRMADADWSFQTENPDEPYTIRVVHFNWKALKLIQFLTYIDENGKPQQMIVDENYKLDEAHGDKRLEREWIPFAYECYKIMDDIFAYCRAVPGQNKDFDNLWECKLSYCGATCDSLNAPVTAPMDRMKTYQYLYNVIIYRIELLMASDKGKVLAANINAIPKSAGINVERFQYFLEANKIAWFNPAEEGNRGGSMDVTNMVKEIDMSLVADIFKYQQLAEYIERRCGASVGVTPQMEAQIAAGEAVNNTQQNLIQSSYIIQPYFELHNTVKANALNMLLDVAKVAYSAPGARTKLTYVLDDMSMHMLTIDKDLLANSRYGLYVANSAKAADAKRAVESLAQAALQNQRADLTDIIKVIKADSINEAEELLEAAQSKKDLQAIMAEKRAADIEKQKRMAEQEDIEAEREHELDKIRLKEDLTTEREIQKQTILSLGFAKDQDVNKNNVPDVMEVAKFGVDTTLKTRKQNLDEQQFSHQQEMDEEKLKLEEKKIAASKAKKAATSK